MLVAESSSKGTTRVRGAISNGGLGKDGLNHFVKTPIATGYAAIEIW